MTYNLELSKVSKMTHNCDLPKGSKIYKNFFFGLEYENAKPIINRFEPIIRRIKRNYKTTCKKRGIKGYKSMSEERLLSVLFSSKRVKKSEKNFDDTKPKIHFSKARIEKIRKEFNESRYKFSKSKVNEIRRNLYEIKNKKSLSAVRMEEIEKNLLELKENLFKPKKYYDYDDREYKGIGDVKDLFDCQLMKIIINQ